ncbi:ADP-ribosylglycohydrolase family protein [Kitasatospora sp. NPDC001683]
MAWSTALDLLGQPHVELAAHRLGNGRQVSAGDTVRFTLWCAARHFDNFEAALWATASAGGDVDTTCAIVGGILAFRLGVQGTPAAWYDAVEPLPGWLEPQRLGTDIRRADFPQAALIARPEPIPVPDLVWTSGQWQRVRHGLQALTMDEKWDACLEGDRFFVIRSETRCLFEVAAGTTTDGGRLVRAWVEADPGRYRRGSDDEESTLLEMLLNMYFGKADRPELWERYRRLRFGS